MGNAVVFGKAFTECGVGGRFSRFQIVQSGDWFKLTNIAAEEDPRYCFRVYNRLDHKAYRKVDIREARALHNDPQWLSFFQTAGKVIAKIVSKGTTKAETRYYVDEANRSVFLINRMFVIEVTPIMRDVHEIPSSCAYAWLAEHCPNAAANDDLHIFSKMGKVVLLHNNCEHSTEMTPEEFNLVVGG